MTAACGIVNQASWFYSQTSLRFRLFSFARIAKIIESPIPTRETKQLISLQAVECWQGLGTVMNKLKGSEKISDWLKDSIPRLRIFGRLFHSNQPFHAFRTWKKFKVNTRHWENVPMCRSGVVLMCYIREFAEIPAFVYNSNYTNKLIRKKTT